MNIAGLLNFKGLVIVGAVAFVIGGASGFTSGMTLQGKLKDHKIDKIQTAWNKEKADEAGAISREVAKQSALATSTNVAAGKHQEVIRTRTVTLVKNVPHYVAISVASGVVGGSDLVPVGAIGLLDAAASGGRPEDFTSGKSLDLATDVTFSQLVANVVDNYGIAEGNSKQLEDLIRWEKESAKLLGSP